MGKIAFQFPGQGSQFVGMGKDLVENYSVAKEVFKTADEALGFSLTDLCFNGPEEKLRLTMNTQPAILTVSIAIYEILKAKSLEPDIVAGHSLGEYSALVAAGVISFSDAVRLVRKRGQFMQEAVPVGEGSMAAILGLDRTKILDICQKIQEAEGPVQAVNLNCPGQTVIAGSTKAVEIAVLALKELGAKRAVILPVSAPFHSSLMKPAAEKLALELDQIELHDAGIPVVANVSGKVVKAASEIKILLVQQAASPVLWEDCTAAMVEYGADVFVEVGPGKVLSGFTKKIAKNVQTIHVEDINSLEKTLDYFGEVR